MTKGEFLLSLRDRLAGMPEGEVGERLNFYSEAIDDRMEEGFSEEEAVARLGDITEIASQIVSEIPLAKIAIEKLRPKRRLKVWEILFISLGSPLWLSLLIALLATVISLYASLWSIVVSLWAVCVSLVACAVCGVLGGAVIAIFEHVYSGAFLIGAGLICAGLSIFMFIACKSTTKWCTKLAKITVLGIKNSFRKKEGA